MNTVEFLQISSAVVPDREALVDVGGAGKRVTYAEMANSVTRLANSLLGLGIDYSGLDPIKALYWSAVLNGVIAVPMMAALMVVAGSRRKMGEFRVGPWLGGLGWLSCAMMAAATVTMVYVALH